MVQNGRSTVSSVGREWEGSGESHKIRRLQSLRTVRLVELARAMALSDKPGSRDSGEVTSSALNATIRSPTPLHSGVPSVQPVLDSQAWHSFEIGSIGGQEKCVVDQRRRRDFQIP